MALNWCKRDIVEKSKIKHRKNLWFERHGFEIQTEPYNPTWLTENYPLERFFYSQKLLYTKNQWTVWTEVESPKFENYNQVSRFRPKLQKKTTTTTTSSIHLHWNWVVLPLCAIFLSFYLSISTPNLKFSFFFLFSVLLLSSSITRH